MSNEKKYTIYYDIYYRGVKLNSKSMGIKLADAYISSCIMNYGYRPEKVEINNNNKRAQNDKIK